MGNPLLSVKPLDFGDTPLLNHLKTREKERRAKREKKHWRGSLETVDEEKRPKWYCAECGVSKQLEEDPDHRGTFYCIYCWEVWESQPVPVPKVKKKKKKSKYEDEEEEEVVEEVDEAAAKKKKKKHKDRDATAEAVQAAEWYGGGEEADGRRRRKKKHDRYEEAYYGEDTARNRWRVKKTDSSEWYEGEWDQDKHYSKRRSSHKDTRDEWWEEPVEETSHKKKSDKGRSNEKAEEGSTSRWKAKDSQASEAAAAGDDRGEREEKSRRHRKDKKGAGDEGGGYWVPKSR